MQHSITQYRSFLAICGSSGRQGRGRGGKQLPRPPEPVLSVDLLLSSLESRCQRDRHALVVRCKPHTCFPTASSSETSLSNHWINQAFPPFARLLLSLATLALAAALADLRDRTVLPRTPLAVHTLPPRPVPSITSRLPRRPAVCCAVRCLCPAWPRMTLTRHVRILRTAKALPHLLGGNCSRAGASRYAAHTDSAWHGMA